MTWKNYTDSWTRENNKHESRVSTLESIAKRCDSVIVSLAVRSADVSRFNTSKRASVVGIEFDSFLLASSCSLQLKPQTERAAAATAGKRQSRLSVWVSLANAANGVSNAGEREC